ncbi:hybrid sensor histidine kinase/response regulator [Caldimonas brevitalea]|uniref:histidine kinase n=1 Tax=Caldimonas brevitalea TaxID=413882 RepID=A0A0G3BMV3_9BURK|nr:ATP-binding protein [Caldimonas brevitalea]AKJ27860.1 chemotaxis protein methyltransferase CheR [Caldimonas brevitalea]
MKMGADTPAQAGRAEERLRLLGRVAGLLAASKPFEDVLGKGVESCLPTLGEFGHVDLVVGQQVRRVRCGRGEAATHAAALLGHEWSQPPCREPNVCALSSGRAALHVDLGDACLRAMARGEHHLARLRQLALTSMITVPLHHGGELVGALTLFRRAGARRHGADDLDFAQTLAALLAPAWVSARLQETQRQAESALRESEERLRLAVDAGRLGIWDWDVVQDRLRGSARIADWLGVAPGTFGGRFDDFLALLHPDDVDQVKRQAEVALQGRAMFAAEFRVVQPDGRVRWLASQASVHRDGAGRPLRVVGATHDATERVELLAAERCARADAEAARRDAEAASRAKDEFLAMLGHELRNPLAPIVTALRLMEMRGEPLRPEHALISRQVAHLSRLVDDLLDVSRITQGQIELTLERLDIAGVLRKAVEQVWPALDKRGLQFDAHLPLQPVVVQGDASRLAQVFVNLLANAAKYTPAHGRIELTVEPADQHVVITVSDNGAGISAALLPHVFDLFVQGPQRLDRMEGGLGLGLAIARSLVRLHGGQLCAASDGPGRGSRFRVELPLAPPQAPPATLALGGEVVGAGLSGRLLIVDDNEDAADMLEQLLSLAGHQVRGAGDAQAALAAVAEFKPDLAVLDIGLPGMDGYALARRLLALPGLADLRLVALTGYGREPDREHARQAGFHAHLVKPVEPQRLLQTVEQLLAERRDARD